MSTTADKIYNARVRLDEEQERVMKELAKEHRRSLNAEIGVAVDLYIEAMEKVK